MHECMHGIKTITNNGHNIFPEIMIAIMYQKFPNLSSMLENFQSSLKSLLYLLLHYIL